MGKTTVSKKLATKLDARYVGVTELVKNEKLFTRVDEKRKTLVADTEKTSKMLQKILAHSEGFVIVEGHYVVDVVAKEETNKVFVLRRNPHELKTVLENRGYPPKKVYENLAAEILDVCLSDAMSTCGVDKVCEVDVTNKTVDAVVDEIILMLQDRRKCRIGTVDWLTLLEKEGQLEDFLKNY